MVPVTSCERATHACLRNCSFPNVHSMEGLRFARMDPTHPSPAHVEFKLMRAPTWMPPCCLSNLTRLHGKQLQCADAQHSVSSIARQECIQACERVGEASPKLLRVLIICKCLWRIKGARNQNYRLRRALPENMDTHEVN